MKTPIAPLAAALAAVDEAWGGCGGAADLNDHDLLQVNARIADLRRLVDAAHARVAAEIASRSRPELGKEGLARKTGHRTPIRLIAATTGGHAGDAARLIQLGEATAPRTSLSGEAAAPVHPHVAAAVERGSLSVPAGVAITTMLDKLPPRVDRATRLAAEKSLAEQAPLLLLDDLQKALRRAEAMLDPQGLSTSIEALRADTWLKIREDAAGHTILDGRFSPDTAAPIVAAIQSIVTHQLRLSRGRSRPSADGDAPGSSTSAGAEGGAVVEGASTPPSAMGVETRSIPQLNAAALESIARHVIGCDENAVPGASTTVIVRMSLDQLRVDADASPDSGASSDTDASPESGASSGTGASFGTGSSSGAGPSSGAGRSSGAGSSYGTASDTTGGSGSTDDDATTSRSRCTMTRPPTIDGIAQPIDAGSARRMAATAGIIPIVFGTKSEILDLGRERRPFSKAQRIALGERDGGCAGCGLPPAFTEAHHLVFWSHGGHTDLDDGVLLCTACHHRVHDEGWKIRIEIPPGGRAHAGTIWFVPPAHIDPTRAPRLGGRRRFDPLLWNLVA